MGRPFVNERRIPQIIALKNVEDSGTSVFKFTEPSKEYFLEMQNIFLAQIEARQKYIESDKAARDKYIELMYPLELRKNLLLLTLDMNPYYVRELPRSRIIEWKEQWLTLAKDMQDYSKLNWVNLTSANDDFTINDYMDLGHLTPSGQAKLASRVSKVILEKTNWGRD